MPRLCTAIRTSLFLCGLLVFPATAFCCASNSLPGMQLQGLRQYLQNCMRDRPGVIFDECEPGYLVDIGGVDGFLIREYGEDYASRIVHHTCSGVLNLGLLMASSEYTHISCRLQAREIAETAHQAIASDLQNYCGIPEEEPTCESQNGVVTETEVLDQRDSGGASTQTTQETIDFHSDLGAVDFIADLQSEISGENRRNCAVLSMATSGGLLLGQVGPMASWVIGAAGGEICSSASENIQEFRAGDRLVRIRGEFTTSTGNVVTVRDTMVGFRRLDDTVEIIVLNRFANRPGLDQLIEQELVQFLDRENGPCSGEGALSKD